MWVIVAIVIAFVGLVAWRLYAMSERQGSARPVDSGHPHLPDVDPHGADGPQT